MTAIRRLAVVPPIVPQQAEAAASPAGAWIVDPKTGYVDQVKRRAAFERLFPDAEFTFTHPGVDVSFTLAGRRVELHDAWELGRLLDKCDAEIAKQARP